MFAVALITIFAPGLVRVAQAKTLYDGLVPVPYHYAPHCLNDTSGADGPNCLTDNRAVSAYIQSTIGEPGRTNIRNRLIYVYGAMTVLNVSFPQTPDYTGSGETDIVYQKADNSVGASGGWPSGIDGETWCDDAVDGTLYQCDQAYVRYETSYTIQLNLACHETGHAVGLVHGVNAVDPNGDALTNGDPSMGCMRTPAPFEADKITAEQIQEINQSPFYYD